MREAAWRNKNIFPVGSYISRLKDNIGIPRSWTFSIEILRMYFYYQLNEPGGWRISNAFNFIIMFNGICTTDPQKKKKYAYQYFYWKTIQGKGMNYLLWSCSIVCISNLSNWLTSQDLQKRYNQQYSKPFSSWLCRKLSLILLKVVKTWVDTYDIINHWGKGSIWNVCLKSIVNSDQ